MMLAAIAFESLKALSRHRLRSALSVLGVTIGVGAVICTVAIGSADSALIEEQLGNLGDNLVWVEAGSRTRDGVRLGTQQTKTLVVDDVQAIEQQVSLIDKASPQVDAKAQVIYGNKNWFTSIRGMSPEYMEIRHWVVEAGTPFSRYDVDRGDNVCVLGASVARNLFDDEDPIGKTIRVRHLSCQVIGRLRQKGQSPSGQDQDDVIFMPHTTVARKLAGVTWLNDIVCSAVSPEAVQLASQQVTSLLRHRHHLQKEEDDDFAVRHPEEVIQARLDASRTFALWLMCIASVSLLVGGVGIMNVMLVSVTERTREIGVRLAIGARESQIKLQFLGESVLLSLLGGVAGMALGVLGSVLLVQGPKWSVEGSLQGLVLSAIFSMGVGVLFGYYPAHRASSLDPIEALRFE